MVKLDEKRIPRLQIERLSEVFKIMFDKFVWFYHYFLISEANFDVTPLKSKCGTSSTRIWKNSAIRYIKVTKSVQKCWYISVHREGPNLQFEWSYIKID